MIKAPFPWFGGKSRCAHIIWSALGDVAHYVEPFAGSLAVLLARPHEPNLETVNDIDRYLVNFWRALQHVPDEVAHHANNPVNESDLTARHIWLVGTGDERLSRIDGDPGYYDVKVAGWWVWGICCWIGCGWCAGNGPWGSIEERLINLRDNVGSGRGVDRKRIHLGYGHGVNRKSLHAGAAPAGTQTGAAEIARYLSELAERLRYVCVCCGDWKRVVTPGALTHGSTVGVFFDPPYDVSMRDSGCYNTDAKHGSVSADVWRWCMENGNKPRYRIVLAGYEGEHNMPDDWRMVKWLAGRSYPRSHETANENNRKLERLWLSPNCLVDGQDKQMELF